MEESLSPSMMDCERQSFSILFYLFFRPDYHQLVEMSVQIKILKNNTYVRNTVIELDLCSSKSETVNLI